MKGKGQPCKAQGEELSLQRTVLSIQISLFQGAVKDLDLLIPGCKDEQNSSKYNSPDYYPICFVVSGTMALFHQ